MFDLKTINLVLDQLSEERGIPREKMLEAIEGALATAYKKEYGKRDQIVRAHFNMEQGDVDFFQVKVIVLPSEVRREDEEAEEGDERPVWNEERYIFLDDAKRMKRDAVAGDEIVFPLEKKTDFGRIAAQTAKQVIMQKIREAERASVVEEYGGKEGDIVNGVVQRMERGNIYVDLGRATGIMPYHEQIPGERYRPGERIRAYLFSVEEGARGVFLRLSRSHPKFLEKLFEMEVPELASGAVAIKAIAREAGGRSKLAVVATDDRIDPVGALVGQRGVRVSTVMSELGGERIDIIEWSEDPVQFIEDALSPAEVLSVALKEEEKRAIVEVSEDQLSLAIGRGGQNVRLAAKLTGWAIDIKPVGGTAEGEAGDVEPSVEKPEEGFDEKEGAEEADIEKEESEESPAQPPEEVLETSEETAEEKAEAEAIEEAPAEETEEKAEEE
ncbi:MAG: transcription termination/antitermination protein NusA [Patescibacteria group bacterium]|nr:transcription termination/antitermination protein NusA [Patescibacteria group bacterium]